MESLLKDNMKLVEEFNAKPIGTIENLPNFYTFRNNLIFSHRDFDKFLKRLEDGEESAIVSGLNASGELHMGHKVVFDTNLFFQKEFNMPVFIPLSDDESYLSKKVSTQEAGLENAMNLAKDLIAYGFDMKKTYIAIDQIYTDIYNLAIKLSRHITMSEIKAIYGYKNEDNIGMHFYPTIQSAHVLLPQELMGIKNVLVPIGPDEDAHLRSARDVASRTGYEKPAVLHTRFMPGLDGEKMSKSRGNAIFYSDDDKTVSRKVSSAFSGGRDTVEEHRRLGGNPEVDIACIYLKNYYLGEKEAENLFNEYRSGRIMSGEVKEMLKEKIIEDLRKFRISLANVSEADVDRILLRNK